MHTGTFARLHRYARDDRASVKIKKIGAEEGWPEQAVGAGYGFASFPDTHKRKYVNATAPTDASST